MDQISLRALNRTTLRRQHLLERTTTTAKEMVEHLVGMQGQNPHDPYYALWSRIESFEPEELSGMLERRDAVRAALMRATLHLTTTFDYLALRPQFQSVLSAVLGSTSFARDTVSVNREQLLGQGRALLEEKPMTRAELGRRLEEAWPGVSGSSLAQVVTYLLPLVQVTPRGLWGRSGQAAWANFDEWAGVGLDQGAPVENTVLRYLGAFGPASVTDMRAWSRLPGLRAVVDRLRPQLREYRGTDGTELLDLPDAPIVAEETPAPPRFLPEYDNLLLAHQDRSRFFVPGVVPEGWVGNLLVDGLFSGSWKIESNGGAARARVALLRKISRTETAAVTEEAERLLRFSHPDLPNRDVVIERPQ